MPTATISRCGGGAAAGGFLEDLLLTSPDALWRLNETSGTTAFDSLPGHHDAPAVGTTPTWAQSVAPPGDTSALFPTKGGFVTPNPGYTPNLTGDFSAAVWVRRNSVHSQTLMGQGQPVTNDPGWQFNCEGVSDIDANHFALWIRGGGVSTDLPSNSPITLSTWYWLTVTHAGTLWTFYVNGAPQIATYSGAYLPATGQPIWIGWDNIETYSLGDFNLSFASLWATRALSASEIAGLYLSAVP